MNKRKLWIPLTLLVVGVFATAIVLHYSIKEVVHHDTVNRQTFTDKKYELASEVQSVQIKIGMVDRIQIYFTNDEAPRVEVRGDLNDFSVQEQSGALNIHMKSKVCVQFLGICNRNQLEYLTVYLPHKSLDRVSIDAVSYDAFVVAQDALEIKQFKVQSVNADLNYENVYGNFVMDGVDTEVHAKGFSGTMEIHGVNLEAKLEAVKKPVWLRSEGVDSTVTLIAPLSYKARLEGVSSRLKDSRHHVDIDRSLNPITHEHPVDGQTLVDVVIKGVDQRLNVE